jgi:DNA-binding response OmpR family regulator
MYHFVDFETDLIDFIMIDGRFSLKDARTAHETLQCRFPVSKIKIITNIKTFCEHENSISSEASIMEIIDSLSDKHQVSVDQGLLKISTTETAAFLLGYPLRLTKSEYKILLLLASYPEKAFQSADIVRLAFPFSPDVSKNHLAVHVCNINKKAEKISGRKLIVNPHKNGYTLNFHL